MELISREAAIEAIKKHKHNILDGGEWDKGIEYGYAAAHNHICEVISHIPTAKRVRKRERERKNTMRWIPVTERLPEVGRNVLLSVGKGLYTAEGELKHDGTWVQYRWSANIENVDAWAEMPEPWRGEEG